MKAAFTGEQIDDIRRRILARERPKDIAAEYGVAPSTITRVKQGKARPGDEPIVVSVDTPEGRADASRARQAEWRLRNPEKCRAYAKRYAASETRKASLKAWEEKNRDALREKRRAWSSKREETIKQQNAEWHQRNLVRRTNAYLVRTYGITLDEYNAMLAGQGGGCASCGVKPSIGGRRMPVDHCHATGRVRGILCTSCNITLGRFNDDASTLRQLADYLDRSAK